MIALEAEGIPTTAVATTAFVDAAATQAEHLGLPEYEIVTVPHPVQNATAEEIVARADAVLETLVARITTGA